MKLINIQLISSEFLNESPKDNINLVNTLQLLIGRLKLRKGYNGNYLDALLIRQICKD